MGEVGLEQHVVGADLVDELVGGQVLEPVAAVHLATEILAGAQAELRLHVGAELFHLVVERLQHERDPADSRLHRHDLERRVALQHPGEDQVGQHPGVGQIHHGRADGQLFVVALRGPWRGAEPAHRALAGPDVEVHREPVVAAELPQRPPRLLTQVGQTSELGITAHHDSPQAQAHDALGLGQRALDVPPRDEPHREQPLTGVLLDLGHGVVVHRHAQPLELHVLDLAELLAAESGQVGVDDLGVDADLVHDLHPGVHVVGAGMDVFDGPAHEVGAQRFGAVGAHHPAGRGEAQGLPVEDPVGPSVHIGHLGEAVNVVCRRPAAPKVVGLS